MFDALFILSIIGAIIELISESFSKPIPAENWANQELYHKDIMDGVTVEQRLKNLKNGKYKLDANQCEYNSQMKKDKEEYTKTKFEKRYGL